MSKTAVDQRTRDTINRMGLWPVGLEQWPNAKLCGPGREEVR